MNTTSFIKRLTCALLLALPMCASAFEIAGAGQVTYVADGDTFRVEADDSEVWQALRQQAAQEQQKTNRNLNVDQRFDAPTNSFVIRVGNIDTAESVHPDASRNSAAGKRASEYAQDLLRNQEVSFICWDIGYYGRVICSVWNEQWEFGSHMIARGLSPYITEYGQHPFWHEGYQKAAQAAQAQMR